MNLYLIRHGETTLNRKKVYYGSSDCDLTEIGEAQARSLRPVLGEIPFDRVWVSPLKRARRTLKLALGDDNASLQQVVYEERLREAGFGEWEGKSYQQLADDPAFQRWCDDWQHVRPPGGESFADLAKRVRAFYEETLLPCAAENALIVAHHGVLRQLSAILLGLEEEGFWHFSFAQGSYSLFSLNDGYAVLHGHNLGQG